MVKLEKLRKRLMV